MIIAILFCVGLLFLLLKNYKLNYLVNVVVANKVKDIKSSLTYGEYGTDLSDNQSLENDEGLGLNDSKANYYIQYRFNRKDDAGYLRNTIAFLYVIKDRSIRKIAILDDSKSREIIKPELDNKLVEVVGSLEYQKEVHMVMCVQAPCPPIEQTNTFVKIEKLTVIGDPEKVMRTYRSRHGFSIKLPELFYPEGKEMCGGRWCSMYIGDEALLSVAPYTNKNQPIESKIFFEEQWQVKKIEKLDTGDSAWTKLTLDYPPSDMIKYRIIKNRRIYQLVNAVNDQDGLDSEWSTSGLMKKIEFDK